MCVLSIYGSKNPVRDITNLMLPGEKQRYQKVEWLIEGHTASCGAHIVLLALEPHSCFARALPGVFSEMSLGGHLGEVGGREPWGEGRREMNEP